MVIGCSTRANSSTSTANTMRMPVTMASRKLIEQLVHVLGLPDLHLAHARGQVLQRRQRLDLVSCAVPSSTPFRSATIDRRRAWL